MKLQRHGQLSPYFSSVGSASKTLAKNLSLAIVSVVITLVLLEAVLAVTMINTSPDARFIDNKGFTYIPHAYYRHTKEGYSEGRFNSHGFRDYERTIEKPSDVFRILVLGDSYVEALQVQLEDSFTVQLEKLLNAKASSLRFEVLSLGHSGFGTADEYVRYLNFGVDYQPDLVILAFLTGNDFRNNSRMLNREGINFYYVLDNHHKLVLDRSLIDEYQDSLTLPKRLFQVIKTHSRLLALISERMYLLKLQRSEAAKGKSGTEGRQNQSLNLFSDLNIYRTDLPPEWKEAVEITREIIVKFKQSVEQHGSRFLLLTLSNAEQVHPEVGAELKNNYKIDFDFDQPDRLLEEFARQHQVPFLKLMPDLRRHHLQTGEFLHGFGSRHQGHWNQIGHRRAAQLTFQFLKDQHLLPLEG